MQKELNHKIITISREYGSGGLYIGEMVAKRLGIPFYDRELIDRIAEETGLVKSYVERFSEHAPSTSIFAYSFVGRSATGESIEDHLLKAQRKVIVDLASEGPCVIVGRSADYILRNCKHKLDVFIQGDAAEKKRRVVELKGVNEKDAAKVIRDIDKRRSINYKYYTGQNWGDRENYTVVLNSTRIGLEKCVDVIVSLYEAME